MTMLSSLLQERNLVVDFDLTMLVMTGAKMSRLDLSTHVGIVSIERDFGGKLEMILLIFLQLSLCLKIGVCYVVLSLCLWEVAQSYCGVFGTSHPHLSQAYL